VSHSPRLLHSLKPDHVHIMIHGEIRESGGAVLIRRLEREGFRRYRSSSSSSPVRSQVQALSSHPHPPHC
jgi:Fe-S cluster assembly ATP-binding protein